MKDIWYVVNLAGKGWKKNIKVKSTRSKMPKYLITEKKNQVIIKREKGYYYNNNVYSNKIFVLEANSKKKALDIYRKIQDVRKQAEMSQVITSVSDTTKTESRQI